MSKIESMKNMLCRAFKEKINVDYVLMDSWFTCYDLISHVVSLWKKQVHVIGRCKIDLTKYEVHGKSAQPKNSCSNMEGTPIAGRQNHPISASKPNLMGCRSTCF